MNKKTLYCAHCGSEVKDGVIREGRFYCDSECAEEHRRDRADNLARTESEGEFTNYEDWMESRGATICDYYPDLPKREY